MSNLILYLLQSAVSLILLYLVYWLFLRKDTFFHINRIYLVFSISFSLLIPLLKINLFYVDTATTYYVLLDAITITANSIEPAISKNLSTFQVIGIVYLTGVCIFLIRFFIQMAQLINLAIRNGIMKKQGLNLVLIDRNYSPFSFFNLIFVSEKDLDEHNIKEIITHEQVHSRQLHSMDIILLELLTIVQWFNPFVWFYRASLKSLHEYLADEGVLLKGFNAINYQNLLLNQSIGVQVNDMTNNFNQSLIKKRIIMMTKNKSNVAARLKLLLVTPVAFMLVMIFTTSPMLQTFAQTDKPSDLKVVEEKLQNNPEEQIFMVVEKMPQYPGGDDARVKFMSENIKYPEEARKAGKTGTAYITYVVEKDGSITNAKVLRGFDAACDAEALRVIKEMPNWTPGEQRGKPVRVQFNMPISFKLDSDIKKPEPPAPPEKPTK